MRDTHRLHVDLAPDMRQSRLARQSLAHSHSHVHVWPHAALKIAPIVVEWQLRDCFAGRASGAEGRVLRTWSG